MLLNLRQLKECCVVVDVGEERSKCLFLLVTRDITSIDSNSVGALGNILRIDWDLITQKSDHNLEVTLLESLRKFHGHLINSSKVVLAVRDLSCNAFNNCVFGRKQLV